MGFKKYNLSIIIVITLIAITPIAYIWVWNKHYMIITLIAIAILWLSEIYYLFYLHRKVVHELENFFVTFEYNDTSVKFDKDNSDPRYKGLHKKFDRIVESFQDFKIDKERELNFFKLAAEHAGVGLLAFSKTGEIKLLNKAFKGLLNIGNEKNINAFSKSNEEFYDFISKIKLGEDIFKIKINNSLRHMVVRVVSFRYEAEEFKLVAIQDIKNEIDQTELDAWQKLIRILRHEIHNSLSPITCLASGLSQQIDNEIINQGNLNSDTTSNIQEGLKVIRKRSIGLSEFVENYKRLTNLPIPNFRQISASKFLKHIESLYNTECKNNCIDLTLKYPIKDCNLFIDEKLIEQVFINIIKNATEALRRISNPKITIEFVEKENAQIISITDNGPGIAPEFLDTIFTPFSTTKENGSGIGLSLSRQIMRLHNGTITVCSQIDVGTTFKIEF